MLCLDVENFDALCLDVEHLNTMCLDICLSEKVSRHESELRTS
jgi:hypothetical protein